jgi:hypothetical protein
MPEAWANANLVLLLRDMLVHESKNKLYFLSGLLPSWVPEGKTLTLENAPVTTGGTVSLRVEHVSAKLWRITVDPHGVSRFMIVELPIEDPMDLRAVRINGGAGFLDRLAAVTTNKVTVIEAELK